MLVIQIQGPRTVKPVGDIFFHPIADLLVFPIHGLEALILQVQAPPDRCPVLLQGSLDPGGDLKLLLICQTGYV